MNSPYCSIGMAREIVRSGGMLLVAHIEENRLAAGSVVTAGVRTTAAALETMARDARGQVRVAMRHSHCHTLGLMPIGGAEETDARQAMVPVNAHNRSSPGLSAEDRAATIQVLSDPTRGHGDLVTPGYVLPFQIAEGGVTDVPEAPEAAVELVELAGLPSVGVVCEILGAGDRAADHEELRAFAIEHDLEILPIEHLVAFRRGRGKPVRKVVDTMLPTKLGTFRAIGFDVAGAEALALVGGAVESEEDVIVRLQAPCLGGALGSLRCNCRSEVDAAMALISARERGALIWVPDPDAGLGPGLARLPARDGLGCGIKDFGCAAQILDLLGIRSVRLITGEDHRAVDRLSAHGTSVCGRLPIDN